MGKIQNSEEIIEGVIWIFNNNTKDNYKKLIDYLSSLVYPSIKRYNKPFVYHESEPMTFQGNIIDDSYDPEIVYFKNEDFQVTSFDNDSTIRLEIRAIYKKDLKELDKKIKKILDGIYFSQSPNKD